MKSQEPIEVYHVNWSPDGRYVAFSRGPHGKSLGPAGDGGGGGEGLEHLRGRRSGDQSLGCHHLRWKLEQGAGLDAGRQGEMMRERCRTHAPFGRKGTATFVGLARGRIATVKPAEK